jgi:foldase protein PrsA
LERQGGKQVLENLIDQTLINQEAKKEKITVSADEIDQEIKSIEDVVKSQGLSLDDALKFRNQTRDDLKKQISLQKTIEKLLSSKITITDAEITDYYTKNKSQYDKMAKFDSLKDQIKSQIFQQKLTDEYTKWVAELRAKAKIHYFVSF